MFSADVGQIPAGQQAKVLFIPKWSFTTPMLAVGKHGFPVFRNSVLLKASWTASGLRLVSQIGRRQCRL